MPLSTYALGASVTLTNTFLNGSMAAYDPAVVQLSVRLPDRSVMVFTTATSPAIVRTGVGVYSLTLIAGENGEYEALWIGDTYNRTQEAFGVNTAPPLLYPDPITLQSIKDRMGGLQTWLRDAAKLDPPYTDNTVAKKIPTAIRRFEEETQTRIRPIQVTSGNLDGTYNNASVPVTSNQFDAYGNPLPIKVDSAYPYYRDDAMEYFKISLRERPVMAVQRLRVIAGQQMALFSAPTEWFNWDPTTGRFWLLPVNTEALLTAFSITFSLIELNFGSKPYIPSLIHVDYQAGLAPGWETQGEYEPLRRCLSEMVALYVIEDLSELYHPGKNSVSVNDGEGLTHTFSYNRFEKRKAELRASISTYQELWKNLHTPFMMEAL